MRGRFAFDVSSLAGKEIVSAKVLEFSDDFLKNKVKEMTDSKIPL